MLLTGVMTVKGNLYVLRFGIVLVGLQCFGVHLTARFHIQIPVTPVRLFFALCSVCPCTYKRLSVLRLTD